MDIRPDIFTAERSSSSIDEDEEQLRVNTRKLLELVEREQAGLVIFGHDGRQWQTLEKAPAWYAGFPGLPRSCVAGERDQEQQGGQGGGRSAIDERCC